MAGYNHGDDDLVYHFGGITDIADAINRFNSEMDSNLNETFAMFQALVGSGTWTGAGAEAFDTTKTTIKNAAADLANTLTQLSTTVGKAAFQFQEADARAAARIYQG